MAAKPKLADDNIELTIKISKPIYNFLVAVGKMVDTGGEGPSHSPEEHASTILVESLLILADVLQDAKDMIKDPPPETDIN
jgi:hypothetical protein